MVGAQLANQRVGRYLTVLVQATTGLNKNFDLRSELLTIRVSEPKDFESDVSFSQIGSIFRKIANEYLFCNFLVNYKINEKTNSTNVFPVKFYIDIVLSLVRKSQNFPKF